MFIRNSSCLDALEKRFGGWCRNVISWTSRRKACNSTQLDPERALLISRTHVTWSMLSWCLRRLLRNPPAPFRGHQAVRHIFTSCILHPMQRRGCHQPAGMENQLCIGMFSTTNSRVRLPSIYQYPSFMWLLLECLPPTVSSLVPLEPAC